jgi:cyclophilin family peptidyl-prolyl cis-trans isomerase
MRLPGKKYSSTLFIHSGVFYLWKKTSECLPASIRADIYSESIHEESYDFYSPNISTSRVHLGRHSNKARWKDRRRSLPQQVYTLCMPPLRSLVATCMFVFALLAHGQSAEPTAVIDTTAGRITCTLLTRERPVTTAHFIALAQGTEPWLAPDGSAGGGKPFYDGTRIYPQAAGIAAGTRATSSQTPAGVPFPVETAPSLLFDRPGLLAMTSSKGNAGPSRFLITDHANREVDGHAVVFGHCDDASVQLVATLRHTLQSTDNHPATPFAINHIAIVPAGKPLPPPAPSIAADAILPVQPASPLAAPSGPEPTGPTAILETTVGRISCRLFTRESPIATGTFLGLVDGTKDWTDPRTHVVQHQKRFYDAMPIDRVLPDFYIQFGDITGDISGKTDIGFRFKNETTPGLTFDRPGRLAFGNGGPDTNNSELFFALNPMHILDGGYPIIGQCDPASVAVLERIAHLPRNASNLPLTPVVIQRIVIQP